jgi:hypothetical protein
MSQPSVPASLPSRSAAGSAASPSEKRELDPCAYALVIGLNGGRVPCLGKLEPDRR